MEIILRSNTISQQVAVSETDCISSLKETFVKSTGKELPDKLCYQDKFGNELSPKLTLKEAGICSGDIVFILYSRYNLLQRISALSLILALLIVGVCALTIGYKCSRIQPFDYAMVFDAGSTHTEMKVFEWQSDKYRGTGIVREVHSCRTEGGIGEVLAAQPSRAGEYLRECLQQGLKIIPQDRRGHSPVFLAATAGMRLLKIEDPKATQEILGNVSRVLQSTGLLFDQTSVRIISGKEEAVSAWVSANYLLQFLHPARGSTIGTIDLGGASTQIAFVEKEDTPPNVSDVLLKLYGEEYDVAALSYLCFGQSQIYKRYLVALLENVPQQQSVSVTSPCHNDGYRKTIKNAAALLGPCTATSYLSSFYNSSITVIGKYDYAACRKAVSDLLDTEKCQLHFAKEFCFSQPQEHDSNASFIGIAGLYYTVSSLNVRTVNSSLREFEDAGRSYCETSWENVTSTNDSAFQTEIKTKLCFNSNFNFLLLTDGYGFDNETWSKITFVNKINGTGIGWQLGFAIRSTNYIPEEGKVERFPVDLFAGFLFLFAFIIGACVTLLVARLIVKRQSQKRAISPSDTGTASNPA